MKLIGVITAKENVKTASYSAVIVAGLGATLVVLYVIFQELFSGETAQSFFQYGSKQCMDNEKVQDLLGEPIKAYGEETRRNAHAMNHGILKHAPICAAE